MRTITTPAGLALILASAAPLAEPYDVELRADFERRESSSAMSIMLADPTARSSVDIESDEFDIAGSWYWNGVDASNGPRSRAAFLAKASQLSLSVSLGRGKIASRFQASGPPPIDSAFETDQDTVSADINLRYVRADSGWFVTAGAATSELKSDDGALTTRFDADGLTLGIGRYLGDRTSIELTVLRFSSSASGAVIGGNSSENDAALALSHVGDLGGGWQFGTDIALSTQGSFGGNGDYLLRVELYPTRDLAIGIDHRAGLGDDASDVRASSVFASWFATERAALRVSIGFDDAGGPSSRDEDNDRWSIGGTLRF